MKTSTIQPELQESALKELRDAMYIRRAELADQYFSEKKDDQIRETQYIAPYNVLESMSDNKV